MGFEDCDMQVNKLEKSFPSLSSNVDIYIP